MSKMSVVCGLIATTVLWTGWAHAEAKEEKQPSHERHHGEKAAERDPALDLDKDGKIDHGEMRKAIDEALKVVDSDKDGKVDHGERKKALKAFREKIDLNKDGKLSKEEVQTALADLKAKHTVLYAHLVRILRERREHRNENKEKHENKEKEKSEDKK